MKKTIVVLVIVLAGVIGVAPNYVGGKTEEQYGGIVEQLRLNGFQVATHEYQRGWLGAQANTELVLPLPQTPDTGDGGPKLPKELRFTLVSTINHGPIVPAHGTALAEIDTQILLNGEQLFPEDYPATLKTVVALDGAMTSRLDLPAKQFDVDSGGATIEFHGLEGTLTTDRSFSRSEIDMSSPGARVAEGGKEVLDVGKLLLKSNAQRGAEGLMLGSGEIVLEHIRASETDSGQLFDIEQVAVTAESHAEGQQVAASMTTQLKSVKAAGREYGRTELTFSMGNLYAPVLMKIQEALDEVRSQNIDPQMQGIAVMSTLMTQAPLLLKHDPKLAIDRLYVETPEGPIDGTLTVQARGMTWDDLQGGFGFLQKLVADATLSLPESLFRQLSNMQVERQITRQLAMRQRLDEEFTPPGPEELQQMVAQASEQQLAALLAQKLIVREGKQLASKAQFDKGKLTVNGNLLELPFLPPPQ